MAIHQADLHESKKERERIDRDAVQSFLQGKIDLASGLGLDKEAIDKLRRQALALFDAGKYQQCIDVVLGIVALGRPHPADALMLGECYAELGMEAESEQCMDHAHRLMTAMGIDLDPQEGTKK